MKALLAATLPNPVEAVANGVGGLVGRGAGAVGSSVLDAVGGAVARGVAGACRAVSDALLGFLATSTGPSFSAGWWAGPRGQQLWGTVAALAGVLMVGFVLLAVVQGLLAGDPGAMVRSVLGEVPVSVAGIVVVVAVTEALLGLTDGASALVLERAPADLGRFLAGFGSTAVITSHGFLGIVMLLVFLLGALLVWIELVVRASLIYLLVAFAPLALAARVWPAARGVTRKLCELGIALIVSKFAIALALGLGAAALAGGGPADPGVGTEAALGLSSLLAGGSLMLMAAFTPFVVLRLLPVLEAAAVAQGVSRSPARAAQTAMQASYYGQGLRRFGGGAKAGAGGARAGGAGGAAGGGGGGTSSGGGTGGPAGGGGGTPRGGGPRPVRPVSPGGQGGRRPTAHRPVPSRPGIGHAPAAASGAVPIGAGVGGRHPRRPANPAPHRAPAPAVPTPTTMASRP